MFNSKKNQRVCLTCHSVGKPQTVTKGSTVVELFLWLMLLLPGMIYSMWRLSSRHQACRSCGGKELVPRSSPRAVQLIGAE